MMKVEPSTRLNPDQIIESDYSYIKRSRQREGATVMDTTHLIYKSGALSHRNSTSAGLDKSIEVPPINTQGRPSWLCPALKQKQPWIVVVFLNYVKSILNGEYGHSPKGETYSWYMSCCQVMKKQNQLPQPSGRRPYGWRLRPVQSSHAVSPAHLRPMYFTYVVSPAHLEKEKKGRADVLGSLSKPMHTRNNIIKHVFKKRVHNNVFFCTCQQKCMHFIHV